MPSQPHFSFAVQGFAPDTFHVVRFSGTEGLSKLYDFELTLLAKDPDLDMAQALSATATFTVHRPESSDLVWKGILKDLRLTGVAKGQAFFKAHLAPKAWLATQSFHNRIFLNQDLVQNLGDCLEDAGLAHGLDFELRLTASYPRREYVCQYNESHFAFVSRWCERNGLYFYFDQSGPQEKLLITDSRNVHAPHPAGEPLVFADASGLDSSLTGKAVKNLQREAKRLPAKVLVKDYNYRIPGLDIRAEAPVSQSGFGQVYVHGGHLRSLKQAAFLASIRAQSLACREAVVFGESNAPFVQPGYLFDLSGHPRKDCNGSFLTVEVRHEGAQEAWLTSGLGLTGLGDRLFYRNGFAAIPSSVQFRAEIKTPRPFIHGSLSARVDAEGSGKYAELDELGRYKVLMPFDVSGRKDGHASSWVRMATPYAGPDHGLHLPLHKGAEVSVIFYEGDPDRPMIVGAMPNQQTPSPVTSDNQTMANLTTSGGNRIHMEDKDGSQRILLHSTPSGDFIRIGHENDPPGPAMPGAANAPPPPSGTDVNAWAAQANSLQGQTTPPASGSGSGSSSPEDPHWEQFKSMFTTGITLTTPGAFKVTAAFSNNVTLGASVATVVGLRSVDWLGGNVLTNVGIQIATNLMGEAVFNLKKVDLRALSQKTSGQSSTTVGTQETTVGQETRTVGDVVSTAGSETHTTGERSEVVASHDEAVADREATVGTEAVTGGTRETTLGTDTLTAAQATHTAASRDLTSASSTETTAESTLTGGSRVVTLGDETRSSGDVTHTSGSTQMVTGNLDVV